MFGKNPFSEENGQMRLELTPAIPEYLLDQNLSIRVRFLGHTDVVYHVPERKAFYPGDYRVYRMELTDSEGRTDCIRGDRLEGQDALNVREGKIAEIEVWMEDIGE